ASQYIIPAASLGYATYTIVQNERARNDEANQKYWFTVALDFVAENKTALAITGLTPFFILVGFTGMSVTVAAYVSLGLALQGTMLWLYCKGLSPVELFNKAKDKTIEFVKTNPDVALTGTAVLADAALSTETVQNLLSPEEIEFENILEKALEEYEEVTSRQIVKEGADNFVNGLVEAAKEQGTENVVNCIVEAAKLQGTENLINGIIEAAQLQMTDNLLSGIAEAAKLQGMENLLSGIAEAAKLQGMENLVTCISAAAKMQEAATAALQSGAKASSRGLMSTGFSFFKKGLRQATEAVKNHQVTLGAMALGGAAFETGVAVLEGDLTLGQDFDEMTWDRYDD
ncbi:MAG: hypothetical protein KDK63_03265, partial [Chlamydiia bacterium]|nr:hypothetical protein [Chlamydiia bacterium]